MKMHFVLLGQLTTKKILFPTAVNGTIPQKMYKI